MEQTLPSFSTLQGLQTQTLEKIFTEFLDHFEENLLKKRRL